MQFLWELLPGAREARNQVIVGYAWLTPVALWVGVPTPEEGSKIAELVDAIGALGVGIAVSFVAFLVGSFSDDLIGQSLKARGRNAFTLGADDPLTTIEGMSEPVRAELERLEGMIDRGNAEVRLRSSLLLPVIATTAILSIDVWYWAIGGACVAGALFFQVRTRRVDLNANLLASAQIRTDIDRRIREKHRVID